MRAASPFWLMTAALAGPAWSQAPAPPPAAPVLDPLRPLWQPGKAPYLRTWLVHSGDLAGFDPVKTPSGPLWQPYAAWSDPGDIGPMADGAGRPDAPKRVYAVATVTRDHAGPADLAIGAAGAAKIWVNGAEVATLPAGTFVRDANRLHVNLKQGDNLVALRIDNPGGDWRLGVRVLEPNQPLEEDRHLNPAVWPEGGMLIIRTDSWKSERPAKVAVLAPGGEVVAEVTVPRGEAARIPLSRLPAKLYDIRISSEDSWGRPVTVYASWAGGDRAALARDILAHAAAAKGTDVEAARWRLLGTLVANRAGADLSRIDQAWIDPELLEAAELAQGPIAAVHSSGFVRLGWVDQVDGSIQFCRAYLPANYDGVRPLPTILYLHGSNPANPTIDRMWGAEQRHAEDQADRYGVIWIEPHGRGNTGYSGIGESDVLNCLAEARRQLKVDEDRTYLSGESMGGMGSWTLGTRHPELWAAIAPIFGGFDLRTFLPGYISPGSTPTERWAFDAYSSFNSAEALSATPTFVLQGDQDKAVEPRFSRAIVQQMQRWGYDVRYREFPGLGHEDLGARDEVIQWMLQHRRAPPPRHVHVRSADLNGASVWWLRVESAEQPLAIIEADAEVTDPGTIRLDTRNVAALTLTPPASLIKSGQPLHIVWNGQARDLALDADGRASFSLAVLAEGPVVKHHGLSGGLANVFTTPYAIVVGTISHDPLMRRLIREKAEQRAAAWEADQHVRPRMVDDVAVTPEMEKSLSLVLIGGADANAVTRRIAGALPMKIGRQNITVDGRRFDTTDAVLEMVRPSPWAPDRYVLVVAATSPGGMYVWDPTNYSLMQLGIPMQFWDWAIQDGRIPNLPETLLPDRGWVASGVWDRNWRRDDRWTFLGDAKARDAATLRRLPPAGFTTAPALLDRYVGRYHFYPEVIVTIRREDGQLMVDAPGIVSGPLTPESDTLFLLPRMMGRIEFERGPDGRTTGMQFVMGPRSLKGTRIVEGP